MNRFSTALVLVWCNLVTVSAAQAADHVELTRLDDWIRIEMEHDRG